MKEEQEGWEEPSDRLSAANIWTGAKKNRNSSRSTLKRFVFVRTHIIILLLHQKILEQVVSLAYVKASFYMIIWFTVYTA